MTIVEFLILILIAGVCGGIAQSIVGYSSSGLLATIALGFIGALLGTWMAREAGLPELLTISPGGHPFPIIWSIIGATLFVAVIAAATNPRRRVTR